MMNEVTKVVKAKRGSDLRILRSRLDNFWKSQDVGLGYCIYDYHAEIHGTGSRSEASSKFSL